MSAARRDLDPAGDPAPADLASGIVLGPAAAIDLTVEAGDWLVVDGKPRRVSHVIDADRLRVATHERSILQVGTATIADNCYVDVDRAQFDRHVVAVTGLINPSPDGQIFPYTRRGDFADPPAVAMATRPQRHAWLLAGMVIGLIMAFDTWTRRSEIAVQRTSGMSRPAIVAISAVTRLLQLWPTTVVAILVATTAGYLVAHRLVPDQVSLAVRMAGLAAVCALAVSILFTAIIASRVSAAKLKDR